MKRDSSRPIGCTNASAAEGNRSASALRTRLLGGAFAMLLMTGLLNVASAQAGHGVGVGVTEFSCTAVTFKYSGFPNLPKNEVPEEIKVSNTWVYKGTFVFNGSSGEHSVSVTKWVIPPGKYLIDAHAVWNTNGAKGTFDHHAKVKCEHVTSSFSIEKKQKLEGEPNFVTSELTGSLGQKVDYQITVKNTGSTSLTFGPLVDAACTGITPSGSTKLAGGAEETFTCSHELTAVGSYSNQASIEGNEGTGVKTSNTVTVKVPSKPEFTIEKSQRIEGEPGYVSTKLTGEVGQTVEYEVVVKNTGNVPLSFMPLTDANCTGITPSGTTNLGVGAEETFTCSHTLTGPAPYAYTNQATIEDGFFQSKPSNTVEVTVPAKPSFTIEKLQEIEGSKAGFTTSKLSGLVGQTVDYRIVVKNTGNTEQSFGPLTDANCTGITPSGSTKLAAGAEETFTCSQALTGPGIFGNEASIAGSESGSKTSNKVEVEVATKRSFTIEKLQEIEGSKAGYTMSKLTGEVGQTVDYRIVVKNEGNVELTFNPLSDANCTGITPSGSTKLAAGAEETFTCSQALTGPGIFGNEASIEDNASVSKTSNKVEVEVAKKPAFTIEKQQRVSFPCGLKTIPPYTTLPFETCSGDTVEYKIVVKNTGNTEQSFGPLTDANCTGITPSGSTKLAAGAEETFTCSHVLTGPGVFANEASISGSESGSKTSNKVEVIVPFEPAFTIEKSQEIEGSKAGFTTSELVGEVGQTVDYRIVVKNTGNTEQSFGPLTDANCTGIKPSGSTKLAAGAEETFTCSHKLTAVGPYTNQASISGSESGSKTSNKVEVEVEPKPSFTIEKSQEIEGSKAGYVSTKLTGLVGQTVDYKIVVKNTGNTEQSFGPLTDANCTGITPSGSTKLAAGAEETFTCSQSLTGPGTFGNEASIEGSESGKETSNKVEVEVAKKPAFTIEKSQEIEGSKAGYVSTKLTGLVGQTVDYRIVVKNTGNTEQNFTALTDANCTGISPSGTTKLAAGAEETFTCSQALTGPGIFGNEASIEGSESGKVTSNKVEVEVATKRSFTIEKSQEIEGTKAGYTTSKLTANLGDTVDYEIVVRNTGNTELAFEALEDLGCTKISPSGATKLAAGGEETFTCVHTLTATGTYSNTARIFGGGVGYRTSNKVEVEVAKKPSFTIEKAQEIEGSKAGYSQKPLTGLIGQTVDYEIVVKNTGNTEQNFTALTDANCTGISPSGTTKLAAGAEETFTCSHKLTATGTYTNEATIEGSESGSETSNKVEVSVKAEPAFTIEKSQEIEGSKAGYTTAKLTANLGDTVDYKIVVKNTGNTEQSFGPLGDGNCTGITPSGSTKLAAGAEETFTCSHKLTAGGTYTNEATIGGSESGPETSNKVEVFVKAPAFTIEKQQKLGGSFTTAKLTGANIGDTVSYQVIVKNTGNTEQSFTALSDPNCTSISPSGTTKLAAGAEETFTCSHKLTAVGTYTNEASIEGSETGKETSNKVEVEVPAKPSFTIEKSQEIEGSKAGYTTAKLTGEIGQTVDYRITVKNTGNIELSFGPLTDGNCTGITPSGSTKLAAGAEETFTCSHKLTATGPYTNQAQIEDDHFQFEQSNVVEVNVPARDEFTIEKQQKIEGEANYTTAKLNAYVGETVDYKIVVKNTGNTELSFGALVDSNCSSIAPSGTTKLAAGAEETFTCTHKLAGTGTYTNRADIQTTAPEAKSSNTVEVAVTADPHAFTIEKQQKIEGEPSYTTAKLNAKLEQTVDYKIIVKNTANFTIQFGALTDGNCSSISPSGPTILAAGGEETFTCSHKLTAGGTYTNEASIEGNEGTGSKTSNKVEVFVAAPSFAIEKSQEIEGSKAGYTTAKLTANLGDTVNYKIVVKNTGNTEQNFTALADANCTGISPSGTTKLAAGAEETFTCSHKLTAGGTWTNEATIYGSESGPETSNKVEVFVKAPAFTIEKSQEIEGSKAGYTTSTLVTKLGETVDYKVVVKNTGNTEQSFTALSDPNCTGITPSGTTKLAAGAEETFTCSHKLTVGGTYLNEASIEGNETGKKTSNKVEVFVAAPAFTIEKQQEIGGSKAGYTTAKLSAKLGETVVYEIVVKDTGNTKQTFTALTDPNCTGISPSGTTNLNPGTEETFTCFHTLTVGGTYANEASIEGNESGKETSNKVEVFVKAPAFTIEKQQKLGGSFTTAKLTGANIGDTVSYQVIVKNTGNTEQSFTALSDPNCTSISPSGTTKLAAGAEETFTCSHKLTAVGTYTNEASIEGSETGKETSNKVEVEVPAKPSFTIEKQQKLGGSFTTAKLTGANIGDTVSYQVIVKNTGNTEQSFTALSDGNCTGISPSGTTKLAAGAEETFTCSHKLTAVGTYTNEASIEGSETGKETSNKVEVEVPAKPSFTIEKSQEIEGSKAGYTTAKLTAKLGETVDYKIVVKNTGNVELSFGALTDANCTSITPSGTTKLAAGAEEAFTCNHKLSVGGVYTNEASITGNEGTGSKTSNKVEVFVAEPSFTIEKKQEIEGEASYVSTKLTAKIGETVDYEILVHNTGNTSLTFGALVDANCTGITPSGSQIVVAGGTQIYTCSHKLTASGIYDNEASVTGNEGTGSKTSNKVEVEVAEPPTCPMDAIESNFNGTKVNSGEWVYFNSVIKPHNTVAGDTIKFTNQKITLKLHNGEVIKLTAPNTTIKFENVSQGSTEFVGGEWVTIVPASFSDNIFLSALDWKIPAGVQIAQAEPVTWEGDFTNAPPGFELQWQWAAAVYSTLPANYNELEVKPLHSSSLDKYKNGDQAGTPENPTVQGNHTEGARGGGGSNYTGSYSGTGSCPDPPAEGPGGNVYAEVEEEPIWLPWPGE